MKKSLFAILIVLCLVVAMIPILASADPATASIGIGNTTITVTEGAETKYYNLVGGTITNVASSSEHNVTFAYPDNGIPTLTLDGVQNGGFLSCTAATANLIIDVIGDNTFTSFNVANTNLTIRTPEGEEGSLRLSYAANTINLQASTDPCTLTFENVDVTLDTTGTAAIFADACEWDVEVNGGSLTINNPNTAAFYGQSESSDLTITDAEVVIMVAGNAFRMGGNIVIDGSNVTVGSAENPAGQTFFHYSGKTVTITDSTLEAYSTRYIYGNAIDLSGWTNKAVVSSSTDFTNPTAYTGIAMSNQKYFKVEPVYTVSVTGGTASSATAPAGTEVTLTSGTAPTGKIFDGWTSSDVTVTNNKFTMPAKNVTVAANFIDDPNNDGEPATVGFWFGSNKQMINRGAAPIYLTTNASGAATTTGANEDNYNIKLTYENGKTPVITLRGAYLKNTYGALHNNNQSSGNLTDNERASKVTIIVEDELGNATSNIPSGVTADAYLISYILLSKGDVEIQGPGKLVMDKVPSGESFIPGSIQAGGDLTFVDADVEVLTGLLKGSNITFDGGKVDVTNTSIPGKQPGYEGGLVVSVWNTDTTILVKDNAQVSMISTDRAAMHIVGANATLKIDSGSLLLKTTSTATNSEYAALKVAGGAKVEINGGTLEVISTGPNNVVTNSDGVALDLEDYANYYAVWGGNANGTGATAFTGTTLLPANSSFQVKYFKLEPALAITVNGGTANPTSAIPGVVVTLKPTVPQGKEFVKWNVDAGSTAVTITDNKFTMPNGPVSVTAEFKDAPAGGGNTPAGHTHSTTLVKGKAPSCTAAGEKDYYKCSCGKAFEDKAATKEIKDLKTWKVLKATGHKDADKDGKCDVCKSAQTSDSSFTALWITVLTLSAMGICVTFVYNKKMRATK